MFVVPKYRPKIYLVGTDGSCRPFQNIENAARKLSRRFLRKIAGLYYWPQDVEETPVNFVLLDEFGDLVCASEVLELKARIDPIRYNTKRYRAGKWAWFRRPKTTQEYRLNAVCTGEPKARAKRRGGNLPNAWDDVARNPGGRSWKNFRKTQWRP